MRANIMKMVMIGIMTLVVTVMVGNVGRESRAKTIPATNDSPVPEQSPDDYLRSVRERLNTPEAQARIQATVLKLEQAYPRLAKSVRKGKTDLKTFLALRKRGDIEAESLLARFEVGEISARRLANLVGRAKKGGNGGGEFQIQGCFSTCETYADMFYWGCQNGGGDQFTCFVETEGFLCMCRNGCTGEPNYFYIECWAGYPN